MNKLLAIGTVTFAVIFAHCAVARDEKPSTAKPLKALLICGGCCHDYAKQHKILSDGIQARANVQVDVIWTNDTSTNPPLSLFENPQWADGYDIIIHDECAADNKNLDVVRRILDLHQRIPAVHLHCAMHSFRTGTDDWFKHLGLHSTGHGPQEPIEIKYTNREHPITKPLSDWTTIKEELYNNVKLHDAVPLATGKQKVKGRGGKETTQEFVVTWINEKRGARSFSTTIGHNNDTVADPRYLELITRGVLWACNKLEPEYLVPFKGTNKITFIPAKPKLPMGTGTAVPKEVSKPRQPGKAQANVIGQKENAVTISASSEETNRDNFVEHAFDGDRATRWCASDDQMPQSITLQFQKPVQVDRCRIVWESGETTYDHRLETSQDGKSWTSLFTGSKHGDTSHQLKSTEATYVRLTVIGSDGGWASIRELELSGPDFKGIALADGTSGNAGTAKKARKKAGKRAADGKQNQASNPLAEGGNVPVKSYKFSSEEESAILRDVKVADGFDVTLFAAPPMVNYPVFVAAEPDGTLYVSSDGNGSLGRKPNRGRVIRLRDTDGDNRADETKIFCNVDAPRGLVWDHDRLFVMHPPHLSVFIDRDHDGVADEQKVLVKNLAFEYKDRPADHTTNGLSMGLDGYLYVAVGDFGFMEAEGTDGRRLQLRGGGVVRLKPDGSDLQLYSIGTRNILEVAISPTLEMFARDNTNDGGGWNVRFHHFTGKDNHGYPRLYKNFADECVAPLADYGGGSGCGAVYIREPGFAGWNDGPFSADWGTGALYRHFVEPKGGTFVETKKPEPIVKMTRPTDGDVDALSRLYCASWKGATFDWEGPNVGYIVCIKPKNLKTEALPEFSKLSDSKLTELLQSSPSYRRQLAAQRELARRNNPAAQAIPQQLAASQRTPARNLVAQLQDQRCPNKTVVDSLASEDEVVRHVASNVAAERSLWRECFAAFDQPSQDSSGNGASQHGGDSRGPILRALAMMHRVEVVTGLLERLSACKDPANRKMILSTLCRLYAKEGTWKGDSWGTRPDTRGPYYQPEVWAESTRIAKALRQVLDTSSSDEAGFLVREMNRNRVPSSAALERILSLAQTDDRLLPELAAQLAQAESVPSEAIPLIIKLLKDQSTAGTPLAHAIVTILKTDSADGLKLTLASLARLKKIEGAGKDYELASRAFMQASKLDSQHEILKQSAESLDGAGSIYADIALLSIVGKLNTSPEARAAAQRSLETGWNQAGRRVQLLEAIGLGNLRAQAPRVLQAIDDPDANVSKVALRIARQFRITKQEDSTPKVVAVKKDDVLASVLKTNGDKLTGEVVFHRANCLSCHTVNMDQSQRGPYLGNIAKTYKRADLAQNIFHPNKTIAQGFATELFQLEDGSELTGFVTLEQADKVTIRDAKANETVLAKSQIAGRKKLPNSTMPEGLLDQFTIREFASLLDYLESLAADKK